VHLTSVRRRSAEARGLDGVALDAVGGPARRSRYEDGAASLAFQTHGVVGQLERLTDRYGTWEGLNFRQGARKEVLRSGRPNGSGNHSAQPPVKNLWRFRMLDVISDISAPGMSC
jgi:hypothetical protein